jgi:DNA helicase-2/ATP-dependent DNA helicase PcrA
LHDKEYISKLFLSRALSISALNNYLDCPWKYFYVNLLRLPKDQNDSQKNGDAVHYALKNYFELFKESQQKPSAEKLLHYYNLFLRKTNIPEDKKNQFRERTEKDLMLYYSQIPDKLDYRILLEYRISDTEIEIGSENKLKLTGVLDRVDFLAEGFRVVDYKTAEYVSLNAIKGLTESSSGDYYRQLVFYKLLTGLHFQNKEKMKDAQIIFLKTKPDEKEVKSHTLVISDTEVAELKKVIQDFAENVMSLDFWNKKCEKHDCEYCRYGKPN